ncbi:hypothetical protein [Streptomyces sp. NPDC048581]|uniref:hypothetical protein n=1 Tax=unclassified Streptomyces TaxID=2593676 RepID=UPI00370FDC39
MIPKLPPPPDACGEPRPPPAPRVVGPWQGRFQVSSGHYTQADGRWVAGRTGGDRLLESACARRPNRWRYTAAGVAGSLVPMAVLMSALLMFTEGDRRAGFTITGAALAGGWLLFTLIYGFQDDGMAVHAGARTLYEPDINNTGREMPLYDLTGVTVVDRARLGPCLRLVRGDHRIVVPCGLLEGNQRLWDLVYHGIRHSVVAGAETDERTRRLLSLTFTADGPA